MASRYLLVAAVAICHLTWTTTCKEISQRAEKRFDVRGKEWMTAQKIINQLVDESIASRVSEAEHDIEHLLESNIAKHIKSTGKTLLRSVSKDCTDKIEHCQALAKSGVCKTSRQAMRMHCAKTCDLCEVHPVDVINQVAPKISAKPVLLVKKKEPQNSGSIRLKTNKYHSTVKITPQKAQTEQSSRKDDLLKYGQGFIPDDTIKILHSIEPLLLQQTGGTMKFHENDLIPANEKIRDAQKLLEYVKVLKGPKSFDHEPNTFENLAANKKQNSELEKEGSKQADKMEMGLNKKNERNLKTRDKKKEKVPDKEKKRQGDKDKATKKPEVNDKGKDKPKPTPAKSAANSQVHQKKLKVKGTPLSRLSKTVTYKNHQYKITPVVDWEKISKMLESLGYKAVHIVGVKNKNIHKDLEDHLKKHGVHKIVGSKVKADKVAAETFVSAVHREKSWHNDQYFKAHCHPKCLTKCVFSCQAGCCPEHDKVSIKTGLANHCHPSCANICIPSCGSGCCSAEEELKRGHNFLHYQKIENFHKAKDQAKQQQKEKGKAALTTQKDMVKKHGKKQDKPDSKCHPQCKETCVESCGKGCCSDDAEKRRDEEKKQKEEMEKERREKDAAEANAKAHEESSHDIAVQQIYKPQPRLCPAPCSRVCAPACADACCAFGSYAQSVTGRPPTRDEHPGFMPNVPYPHSKGIPAEAFACKESCKFSCTYDCPRDCCQPEELATEEAHEAAALASPMTIGSLQTMNYQGLVPEPPSCPSPCPANCFPSCTVACCTSALGLPQKDSFTPLARSSTKRVLHVTHLLRPITSLNGCALSCAVHCNPACARSGCCDSLTRRRKRRRTQT